MKVTREELLRIAAIAKLEIKQNEVEPLVAQLEAFLSYAERVNQIAEDANEPSNRNVNIMRDDVTVPSIAFSILAQAPEREEDYFVVPKIL